MSEPCEPKRLTRRERRFVGEFLIDLNASEAARRTGYTGKRPDLRARKFMDKPHVAAAIEAAMSRRERQNALTHEMIANELMRVAFSDPRRFFKADGSLKAIHELDDDSAAALAAIEFEDVRNAEIENVRDAAGKQAQQILRTQIVKLKRWDKIRALELLGRYKAMFTDVHEHMGKGGAPLPPPTFNFGFAHGGPGQDPGTRPKDA